MDVFGGAPRFLAYPRALTVACGANAVLECRIAGDPRPAVAWERDAAPISPSARHRFLEEGDAYRLVVMKAGAEDSGQYICKAKNRVGETYAAATLMVADGGPGDQPAFLIRPSSARVSRGDDVVFTGRLSGCPQPLVTWEKDGKKLGEIFESAHFSAGTEGEGWHHLKIFGARPPDGGVYLCRAWSACGEATAAAVLLVEPCRGALGTDEPGPGRQRGERGHQKGRRGPQGPVSGGEGEPLGLAKVKAFSVWQGKHAKFRCLVTGKPTPEIVWRKGGCVVVPSRRHLLYQDREGYFNLKLLYCKQADGDLYTCAASNAAGHTLSSVLLHIKEPPTKFRSQLRDVEVREREQAVLECEVPAESMPAAWYLEDRRLQPSAKYIIEQQGSLRRLTIKDVTMDDDGVYLCQMKDGGRSVAEVAVKGKIVKRLPRKLDVLEGENAAFCVDLDEDNVEVRWYKDGELLSESHKTIIKSFGKTHILVFVNASAEDAGVVTFVISDSKSSSQLRVKPRRRTAPGAPENTRMNCERPNAASLTWDPPPDCGSTGAAGYVVERQEVGAEGWVQCLTTRTGSAVEILGDSVPAEGRYRFRVCSINEYGRGGQAEFPGAVHLVPAARILTHLNDATVCQDGEVEFTVELSAVVIGTWHMMGKQIQEDERFRVQQSRSQHSLLIRQVRLQENEAEITFVAHGVRDSAILLVKAAPVRISLSPGTESELCVTASESIVLSCEVSRANALVSWCKDGQEITPSDRMTHQSCGQIRRLVVHSSLPSDSGQYTCDAVDDVMMFCVTVLDPPVRIVNTADDSKAAYLKSDRIVLSCELSRPNAEVKWYKDGLEVEGSANVAMVSHGVHRSLIVQSAGTEDSGEYVCDAGDDSIFYDITVREPRATLRATEGGARTEYLCGETVVLSCEVSLSDAGVKWYKDGGELEEMPGVKMEAQGVHRRLVIPHCSKSDSGVYVCETTGDSLTFTIAVTEPPVSIVSRSPSELTVVTGAEFVLWCEVSRPGAEVRWRRDRAELEPSDRCRMEVEGERRRLRVRSATVEDGGTYVCDAADNAAEFKVTVCKPPVSIVSNSPSELTVVTGAEFVLWCEVSRPGAEVRWRRDGTGLEPSDRCRMEVEGECRRLRIRSATVEDGGTYMCDAADDAAEFKVTVSEPPVSIVSRSPLELTVVTGAEFVLWCEVSRPGAEVRWRQDGAGLEPSDRCRMEVEGECRKLRVRSATVEDGGSYVCDAADDAAEFKVTVSEPPVSIVSCSPSELTVVTGAEFVLWCEVSRPGAEVRWRRDGAGLEPSDRCRMEVEGECRRLRVRSTTVEDGGTYVCDAADDVAEFKVTISEPPVSIVSRSPSELTVVTGAEFVLWCEVSRPGAEVRWRRDGAGLESSDRCRMEVEGERRRLRVRSATVEDGGTYVCDAADDAAEFKVTVSDPPVRITRPKNKLFDHKCWAAEDILLECEVSRVDAQAKWHKDGEKVAEGGRVSTGSEGVVRYLRVLGAQAEDTGEYLCDVQSDSIVFQVTVEEPPVRIVGNDKVSEDRCFVESEAIAMTCELSRPDVGVRWYRDGAELRDSGRIRIDARGLTRELMIFDSEPRDSGQYVCDAGTDRLTFNVTVAEAPVLFTNKGKLPEEVTVNENGKAVLAAIVAKEKASVTWLRHREPVCEGEKYEARHESRVHSLIVKNVQKEDSGFYICRSADDEMIFNVNVMDLPLLFVLSLEDLCVQRDGTVTLWCELTRAKGDVVWLKDGREVEPSCRRAIRAEGRLRSLTLTKVTLEDQGKYVCESKDDRTAARVSVVVPRVVEFISDLHNVTVLEGDEATFKCMVSPEDARVVWKVNDSEVPPGSDQYVASRNGLCRALLIRDCRAGELTRVTAEAEGIVSSANLQVQEAQVLFTKMMASVVVEELQDATFEVEVCGEGAEVQWMKQGVVIQAGSRYLVQQEGRLRRLTVLGATFADRGNYRCETLHDRTQAKLSVEARRIRLRKSLVDMETVEGEAATFQVELSHPDVEGVWIKDGIRIKPCPSRRISVGGRFHSLTLSALTLEDTGTIMFQSDSTRCSARLTVREPPVTFLKQLKDLQVPETTFVTLEAELSRPNVEVRWYKNDLEMKPNNGIRIYSMGRKRIAQLGRCGLEDSGIYTCDAGDDKTSAKLEVYEREIRIVKELEDVEVRENDNAIFVCEVSHEGVKGEWLKNGEKIKANNSVKMRQEGSKHFLLIYKVRAEDAGEIRFMAKSAESAANLDVNELPIKIVKPLRDKTALEKHKVILECKVSKPRARVRWYRAGEELRPTDKYEICSEDCYRKLVVHDVSFEDEDTYTCDAFDDSSSAKVLVEEQAILMVKSLEDVQVTAPGGALLECEVSVPVIRAPQWSLNGQVLQNGKGVRLENNGTVQRLILSETSPEMTGLVKFTAGKARSSAHLTVTAN